MEQLNSLSSAHGNGAAICVYKIGDSWVAEITDITRANLSEGWVMSSEEYVSSDETVSLQIALKRFSKSLKSYKDLKDEEDGIIEVDGKRYKLLDD
jgi:hypothetical protein